MLITRIRLTLIRSKSEHFLDNNRALSTDTYFYRIKRILLISDTHSYFGEEIAKHLNDVDELWHAGDWGHDSVITELEKNAVVRGVYGNIDTLEIRKKYPKELIYTVEG
jgi:IS30 family transposase